MLLLGLGLFSVLFFSLCLCFFIYDVSHSANTGGQYVYPDSQRHWRSGAFSWVCHRVDTQEDYTKTETSKIYQLQKHWRTHRHTHSVTYTPPEKITPILWRRLCREHTHTQFRQLELFPTIFFTCSLCFNSPHLFLQGFAPRMLSLMPNCKQMASHFKYKMFHFPNW